MHLHIDAIFDDDSVLPEPDLDPRGMEALLLAAAAASASAPHAEDALLCEFARFLAARGAGPEERRDGIELAREAIDQLGDAEGPWQALSVERWLHAAWLHGGADAGALVRRARVFVGFLGDSGRTSLHGQRLLARALATVRLPHAGDACAALPNPKLAA